MTITNPYTRYDNLNTSQLVRAAQIGDREAFGELFERYEQMVFSVAKRRLNDYGDAQELTQEVFVKAIQRIDQLRDPRCFGGWLRSIATRMAINRQVRRGPIVAMEPESVAANCHDDVTPLVHAVTHERSDCVHAGLGRLPTMDRETLVAFYVEGQSIREMSDQFEAPVGTIKRRLHVARKRLSKHVESLAAV